MLRSLSSWTRGQGWILYGFTINCLHTGKQEYLDTAKRVAHYCPANIPENGLLELSRCLPELERRTYRNGVL